FESAHQPRMPLVQHRLPPGAAPPPFVAPAIAGMTHPPTEPAAVASLLPEAGIRPPAASARPKTIPRACRAIAPGLEPPAVLLLHGNGITLDMQQHVGSAGCPQAEPHAAIGQTFRSVAVSWLGSHLRPPDARAPRSPSAARAHARIPWRIPPAPPPPRHADGSYPARVAMGRATRAAGSRCPRRCR